MQYLCLIYRFKVRNLSTPNAGLHLVHQRNMEKWSIVIIVSWTFIFLICLQCTSWRSTLEENGASFRSHLLFGDSFVSGKILSRKTTEDKDKFRSQSLWEQEAFSVNFLIRWALSKATLSSQWRRKKEQEYGEETDHSLPIPLINTYSKLLPLEECLIAYWCATGDRRSSPMVSRSRFYN